MHDIKSIRDNPQAFDAGLKRRGLAPLSPSLLAIDEKRRAAILASEQAQARRNAASKEIGDAKKAKDDARASALMAEVAELKTTMPRTRSWRRRRRTTSWRKNWPRFRTCRWTTCPTASTSTAMCSATCSARSATMRFAPKPHDDLGGALGYMDFEAAAKLSGARFVVLKKGLARLERAIGQFMLDLHTNEHGYAEINPPLLVRDDVMFGTGQLPKFEDDQFWAIKGELLAAVDENAVGKLKERTSRAHPHRRSVADQSRPRIHRRRKGIADAADGADAVLSRRGGRCRAAIPAA